LRRTSKIYFLQHLLRNLILITIVKDDSNFAQVKEKNLITKDDLTNCINIYKGNEDKSISDNVKDLEEIVEKMTTKEKEPVSNYE